VILLAEAALAGACSGTCALSGAGEELLPAEEVASLLEAWTAPLGASDLALETLLYHAGAVHPAALNDLDPARRAWLQSELDRTRVTVEMSLVDDHGVVRGTLSSPPFSLREKQHLELEGTGSLAGVEAGGRVYRVGLDHLWSRW